MSDKDYAEVNAFVQWIVDLITKIKEFFASLNIGGNAE